MAKYGTADMGNIDVAEVLQDLMDVLKENKITMPHGLTMLARGLAHVEGGACGYQSADLYGRDCSIPAEKSVYPDT